MNYTYIFSILALSTNLACETPEPKVTAPLKSLSSPTVPLTLTKDECEETPPLQAGSIDSSTLKSEQLSVHTSSPEASPFHLAVIHVKKDPRADLVYYEMCGLDGVKECFTGLMRDWETDPSLNPQQNRDHLVAYEGRLLSAAFSVKTSSCIWEDLETFRGKNRQRVMKHGKHLLYCGDSLEARFTFKANAEDLSRLFQTQQQKYEELHESLYDFQKNMLTIKNDSALPPELRVTLENIDKAREWFHIRIEKNNSLSISCPNLGKLPSMEAFLPQGGFYEVYKNHPSFKQEISNWAQTVWSKKQEFEKSQNELNAALDNELMTAKFSSPMPEPSE